MAFVLAFAAAPAAYAQSNHLANNQLNSTTISSSTNTTVYELHGALQTSSLAGGNTVAVDVDGNLAFSNQQRFFGDARATTNVHVGALGGSGLILSTAFSNNAEVNAPTACCVSVNNLQIANIDPTAVANVRIGYAAEDVTVSARAFSNGMTINGSGDGNMHVNSVQWNGAATHAVANTTIGSIGGDLVAQSSAIGNSLTINNIPRH